MQRVDEDDTASVLPNKYVNRFDIYNESEFQAIIKHEKFRTDRCNQAFSLIIFNIEKFVNNQFLLKKYINIIRRRIRVVDVIGWFVDLKVIGVLLISADHDSAKAIAGEIKNSLTNNLLLSSIPPFNVYSYPHNWNNLFIKPFQDANNGNEPNNNNSTDEKKIIKRVENLFIKRIPAWKRLLDIFISLLFLFIFSPIFLIISLYIKIISPGAILFKQPRVGFRGKEFTLLKFRTMHINNDMQSHQLYLKELINSEKPMYKMDLQKDSRIIPGGGFLRSSGLDELPQLINILRGEMSLVGPRPSIPYEVNEFLLWHKGRFNITPGLTGLWQVSGKNKLSFAQMIRLDIEYGKRMSLWLDLQIIFKTIPTIISIMSEKTMNKVTPQDVSS